MIGTRWQHKPPLGYGIDREHPLAAGLVSFWAFNEGGGPPFDIAANWAAQWTAVLPSWSSGPRPHPRLQCHLPVHHARLGAPAQFRRPDHGRRPLHPSATAGKQIILYTNSTGPSAGVQFNTNSSNGITLNFNNGNVGVASSTAIVDGNWHTFAASAASTAANGVAFYRDGVPEGTATASALPVAPTGTHWIGFGGVGGYLFYGSMDWLGVWDRALSPAEHLALTTNPWQIIQPRRASWMGLYAGVGDFKVSPSSLYSNSPSVTLTLAGYGTMSWSGGTVFTVSGAAGTTKISQSVTDANDATVVVQTRAGVGEITVSDGTHTGTTQVTTNPVSIAATPATIPADHSGNITLTLAGTGTTWGGGTTFTLSGVSGVTKVGQNITSSTSATVTVTTGAGTGTLTITDGTTLSQVAVAVATLSASTQAVPASRATSITMTGTNTVWTQETASALFSVSGVAGSSIANISVVSDTSATLTLTGGAAAGTATLTEASTGATTTLAVYPAASGSLHAIGPIMVGSSASTSLFGNQSAASLAFFLKINSNAGLNLATGTTIVGWGTNASGGVGLAVYYPATGILKITAYGAAGISQAFTASIPVQLGVGYHIALSWTNGAQTLYVNGVSYATGTIAASTFAYRLIQVGGNAGVNLAGQGVTTDHEVSDLAAWSSHAITGSDALALANRTMSPRDTAVPASAWWPLGGSTAGATPSPSLSPSPSDPWFSDYAGNGNALSVVSGTLSSTTAAYAAAIALGTPTLVAPMVSKCGKLAVFGVTGVTPSVTGANPAAIVTAVNGTPTVYRNGTAIQIGPPTWYSATRDGPFVGYQLQCGSVLNVAIQNGGSGYVNPVASASGGGGSGLTLGTPTVQTGIVGYTVVNGGGYTIGGVPGFNRRRPSRSWTPAAAASARWPTRSSGTMRSSRSC